MANWRRQAVCAGHDPETWFPPNLKDADRAIAVCATCPVIDPCRQFAVDNQVTEGVWGGEDFHRERQRRRQAYQRRKQAA